MNIEIQKDSKFWCEDCQKIRKGQGYIYFGKQVCSESYRKLFPKFNEEEVQQ